MKKAKVFGALIFSLVFVVVSIPTVEVKVASATTVVYVTKR